MKSGRTDGSTFEEQELSVQGRKGLLEMWEGEGQGQLDEPGV